MVRQVVGHYVGQVEIHPRNGRCVETHPHAWWHGCHGHLPGAQSRVACHVGQRPYLGWFFCQRGASQGHQGRRPLGYAHSERHPSELLDELETIIASGTSIDINYFLEEILDEDSIQEIFDFFKEEQNNNIEEAYKEFGKDYKEEEIRLVRIKFLSEVAN